MIEASVIAIRHSLPPGVLLVAAAKTRLPEEFRISVMDSLIMKAMIHFLYFIII